MKTKTPSLYSAADVARVISRRLRKAGFLMADTSDRFRWTEGFHVSRVGCSSTVSISYRPAWGVSTLPRNPDDVKRRDEAVAKCKATLAEWGYVFGLEFTDGTYIECERE